MKSTSQGVRATNCDFVLAAKALSHSCVYVSEWLSLQALRAVTLVDGSPRVCKWLVETVKASPCLVEQYFTSVGAKREISL